jgi:hypothetical protein
MSPLYEPAPQAAAEARKTRRKPPIGRRWRPGESGNPAGRPRRVTVPSLLAALERALKGRVTLQDGGRVRRLGVLEAVIERMIDDALAGDNTARRDLMKAEAEREAAERQRREAARAARQERARLAEEAARRAAEAGDPEPIFPLGWSQEQFLQVLSKWNIVVRRGDSWHLRQWTARAALCAGPPADEDDPWAWRGLVDDVGDRRSLSETRAMLEAVQAGRVSIDMAMQWRPGMAVEGEAEAEACESEGGWGEADDAAAAEPPPPRLPPPAPPPPVEDWVERLCRASPRASSVGWMG